MAAREEGPRAGLYRTLASWLFSWTVIWAYANGVVVRDIGRVAAARLVKLELSRVQTGVLFISGVNVRAPGGRGSCGLGGGYARRGRLERPGRRLRSSWSAVRLGWRLHSSCHPVRALVRGSLPARTTAVTRACCVGEADRPEALSASSHDRDRCLSGWVAVTCVCILWSRGRNTLTRHRRLATHCQS